MCRALDQLGLAYLSLDKPQEAEKVLRRAISLASDNAEVVVMHLGRALMALDRPTRRKRIWISFASSGLRRQEIL